MYTQPAEDAVDEAETGLKSSLAVKVFGPDLGLLEQKGRAIATIIDQVAGIDMSSHFEIANHEFNHWNSVWRVKA